MTGNRDELESLKRQAEAKALYETLKRALKEESLENDAYLQDFPGFKPAPNGSVSPSAVR